MKPARNDPCPCGSGRKYKACCMAADAALERTAAVAGSGAPAATPEAWLPLARAAKVWEAEVAPLPFGYETGGEEAPSLAMVMAAGFVVHGDVLAHRPVGDVERARAVAGAVSAARRVLGVLPERLHVRDEALAAALAEELGPQGITVRAAPLPAMDEALDGALEHMGGSPAAAWMTTPATWRETEATPAELADFHAAAAEFFQAAPWESLDDADVLLLTFPDGAEWAGTIMGSLGVEFGLSLYSDPDDVLGMEEDATPDELLSEMSGASLTASFDPRGELTRAMQREVAAAGWEVAGPSAYPRIFGIHLPLRRVTAADVRRMTLALRAVAHVARGDDPEEKTGVRVVALPPEGDPAYWPIAEEATPICPEGPGADPAAALRGWDAAEEVERAEKERFGRLRGWLEEQRLPGADRSSDLRNARIWSDYLVSQALPAGAVTEHDLYLFLYDFYSRKGGASKAAARALPRTLPRIFRFLEEREGIRYPFAAAVLRELEEIERGAREDGTPLEEVLGRLGRSVYEHLDARAMQHDRSLPGAPSGWPVFMDLEVARLERELQRRWLLWYDEAVRKGIVDYQALEQVLVGRQREWENAPHRDLGGRTPAAVVRESCSLVGGRGEGDADPEG
ncbi:MAG TPA: SEC-C domain-containing protein [Longimicrobiaceae bacterium]|nr:SEC-C domain-containing protein [Longimicrobiaceae bacterium]